MSSYLAQGLQQGWATGSQIAADAKRRKFEEEMDFNRRQAEFDRDRARFQSERDLLDTRLAAENERQGVADDRADIRAAQAEGYRRRDREATQGFTADEAQKGRDFHGAESQLARDAAQFAQQRNLDQADIHWRGDTALKQSAQTQAGAQFDRHQTWLENPDNPYNRIRDAQAEKLGSDYGSLPPVGGQFTPKPPPPEAIDMLRKNPQLRAQFDAKYGTGAAARYLAQ